MRKHLQGRGHPPALLFSAHPIALVAALMALMGGFAAHAKPPPGAAVVPQGFDSQAPVTFRMDAMTAHLKGHEVRGTGNVVVRQLPWLLCCDSLQAGTDAQGLWRELTCVGRVRGYVTGRQLWARKAVFSPRDHTLTLTGEPRLTQGEGYLRGAKMVVHTERQEVRVVRPRGAMSPALVQADARARATPLEDLPLPAFLTGTLPDSCPWPWPGTAASP